MSYANYGGLIDKSRPGDRYVKYESYGTGKGSFRELYEDLENQPKKKVKNPFEPDGVLYFLVEQEGQEMLHKEEERREQQEPGNFA